MQTATASLDIMANKKIASVEAVGSLLDRLEEALREENAILEERKSISHETFAMRKNQLLREFMSVQRAAVGSPAIVALKDRMRDVRDLVERNHMLLKAQVDAMMQVTSLLTEAALAEQADGTYSRQSQ